MTSSSTANAVLEAARDIKAPIIIQVSQGGSAYFAGKGLANGNQEASILGAIAAAHHVRTVAKAYGVCALFSLFSPGHSFSRDGRQKLTIAPSAKPPILLYDFSTSSDLTAQAGRAALGPLRAQAPPVVRRDAQGR